MKKQFGETRNYVPKSNEATMREFEKSFIWHDMQEELNVWLTEIRDLLEDDDLAMPERETAGLRGAAKAIRNMLVLPETLADNMKADAKAEKVEKEKENGGTRD